MPCRAVFAGKNLGIRATKRGVAGLVDLRPLPV